MVVIISIFRIFNWRYIGYGEVTLNLMVLLNIVSFYGSCDPNKSTYRCAPFGTEFNDETTVFQRINRGLDLDTGSNDTRSQGVPLIMMN